MRYLSIIICLALGSMLPLQAIAQTPTKETTDPKAKAILDKVKTKYHGFKSVTADFKLTVEFESKKEAKPGKMIMSGDKYKLEMIDQDMYCNGSRIWIYIKGSNEAQVNNASNDDTPFSPAYLFKMYDNEKEVIGYLQGEGEENGRTVSFVEMKPVSRSTDYSKIRMSIDKSTDLINRVIVFGKDGVRYTLDISKVSAGNALDNAVFTFDPSKFPGVRITDISR